MVIGILVGLGFATIWFALPARQRRQIPDPDWDTKPDR